MNYVEFCPVFDKDSLYFKKGDGSAPLFWRVPILYSHDSQKEKSLLSLNAQLATYFAISRRTIKIIPFAKKRSNQNPNFTFLHL